MELEKILGYGDKAAVYGLALVFLLAGVSKFVDPGLWLGFEPGFLKSLLSLTSKQFVFMTGALEAALGVLLATRYRQRLVASFATLWLLGITVTVASMGMWTIALRDFGLVALAYVVASNA